MYGKNTRSGLKQGSPPLIPWIFQGLALLYLHRNSRHKTLGEAQKRFRLRPQGSPQGLSRTGEANRKDLLNPILGHSET